MNQPLQISDHDWQILSEYLDGELSSRDQEKLELRLKENQTLRSALEELRQTRTLLRSVRKQPAPRNFTLSPAMVEQVRKPNPLLRFIPILNFTSAASAFAVIALLFAGLLPGIAPAAAPAPIATSAASIEIASNAPQEPGTVILWNGVPSGGGAANDITMGKGGGGGSGSGFVLPPQIVQNITAEPGATSKLAPEAAGAPESADNAAPQADDPAQPQVMAAAPAQPLTGSGPILGAVSPEDARSTNQSNVEAYTVPVERESIPPVSRWWLAPAIALGVVALASALGAQWLRRKTRA